MPLPSAAPPLDVPRYHLGKELLRHPAKDSHIVQFYKDEAFLVDVLVQYLEGGFAAGEPLIVIARESHRRALTERLTARGTDVEAACRGGQLTLLDARQTLSRFLVDGAPDPERFQEVIGGVLARATEPGVRARAYGEMVDLLWEDGLPDAAVALEALWNDLAAHYPFSLLCSYALGGFGQEAHARPFRDICQTHSHVVPTESYAQLEDPDCRLREVSLLQQRAQALENEVAYRKQVEQELRDALRSRDDFIRAASHELRTPLTALPLQAPPKLPESTESEPARVPLRERLARATRHTERLSLLVEGLLDVSRVSVGQLELALEEVDLSRLVHEVVARATDAAARTECHVAITAEKPVLGRWDRQRLEQVFLHLLDNALKYGRGHPVEVRVEGLKDRARLVVTDHGIGIPLEHHDRIFRGFERDESSQQPGVGLGLWLVQRLVEAHAGCIQFHSKPAEGATFIVELPYGVG